MKPCVNCSIIKEMSEFKRQKFSKNGISNTCKECANSYLRKKRTENKLKFKDYDKTKYLKNQEEIKQTSKEYYNKNKENVLKKVKSYRTRSKEKRREWSKVYYSKNKETILKNNKKYDTSKSRLKRLYNLELVDYNKMLIAQNNCCAICKIPKDKLRYKLSVDHCHKTGKVRGLLCSSCNTALGLFKDNIISLETAIVYLGKNNEK